jgi:hypothetical protein
VRATAVYEAPREASFDSGRVSALFTMTEQTKSEPVSTPPAAPAGGLPKVNVGIVFLAIAGMMVYNEVSTAVKQEQQKDPKVGKIDAISNYFLGPEEERDPPMLRNGEVMIQFCMS